MKKTLAILLLSLVVGCGESEQSDEAWGDFVAKLRARLPAAEEHVNTLYSPNYENYQVTIKKTAQEGEITVSVTMDRVDYKKRITPNPTHSAVCYFGKQNGKWMFEGQKDPPLTNELYTPAIDFLFKEVTH